ncbi:unnamed protein product [Mytilus coruscus]|uniref:Uncharacterized protein n=1 Tax=Mytilus coruscus TaxID=42192 RepID=A0A6J8B976_MYTCO|nr:unnamed protein product [Mytilus coruscus]
MITTDKRKNNIIMVNIRNIVPFIQPKQNHVFWWSRKKWAIICFYKKRRRRSSKIQKEHGNNVTPLNETTDENHEHGGNTETNTHELQCQQSCDSGSLLDVLNKTISQCDGSWVEDPGIITDISDDVEVEKAIILASRENIELLQNIFSNVLKKRTPESYLFGNYTLTVSADHFGNQLLKILYCDVGDILFIGNVSRICFYKKRRRRSSKIQKEHGNNVTPLNETTDENHEHGGNTETNTHELQCQQSCDSGVVCNVEINHDE